jgi:hypothetical protein
MTERLLLYHGTDRQRVGDIARTGNLYGYRCPANPNYSGTLTDSLAIAGVSAQKKVDFGRHRPAILHFQIPTDKLICEGPIGNL